MQHIFLRKGYLINWNTNPDEIKCIKCERKEYDTIFYPAWIDMYLNSGENISDIETFAKIKEIVDKAYTLAKGEKNLNEEYFQLHLNSDTVECDAMKNFIFESEFLKGSIKLNDVNYSLEDIARREVEEWISKIEIFDKLNCNYFKFYGENNEENDMGLLGIYKDNEMFYLLYPSIEELAKKFDAAYSSKNLEECKKK